ncbi:unnamed protein product [Closterium sp. Yama58-4]|nr:unnamed protein product [Closterium sp. Yama58-4]
MASVGPIKCTNPGYATRSFFTSPSSDVHGSAFRSAVLSSRLHSNHFPTTTITSGSSSSSISSISSISSCNPLSILPQAVLPLVARHTPLASHSSPSTLLSNFLPIAHCRAESASDQTSQPWTYQASRTGSGTGFQKEQSNGKGNEASRTASAASDDDEVRADVSRSPNVITGRVDGKLYTVKLRSLYSAFCPRGMLIMAIAVFRNMGAERIAAGAAWLSLREVSGLVRTAALAAWLSLREVSGVGAFGGKMAVISVRRALEHFYLARSVSVRWLWKLTKDPTQSAIRKVNRGLTGSTLIRSVTITNVRAHFLSPLSSVAVQLITDTFTAFHRLLFPPPPPPQAGQGLAISSVRAAGVQIVWLVKRTLSYSLRLVFSTVSGALVSAVCVRYVGTWTTNYAYILGDMLVFQTASSLIDPLLFTATTPGDAAGAPGEGGIGGATAGEGSTGEGFTASTAASAASAGGAGDFARNL